MASRPEARFRALLWTAVVFVVVFVCLQFIRPELTNPPVTAELQAPPEVKQVLKSSCYNCHSNETKAAEAAKTAADVEYGKWIRTSTATMDVKPEFNGVAYIPDYKNWKVISSTDRFDNHTLREIFGNDVAVKAIAENHINPWPDGTMFAKVAWAQSQPDENGVVKTGAFVQVELM